LSLATFAIIAISFDRFCTNVALSDIFLHDILLIEFAVDRMYKRCRSTENQITHARECIVTSCIPALLNILQALLIGACSSD
jgi:hypothetical protein